MRFKQASAVVVVQGEYVYRCDGRVAPVTESWQLLQVGDGYEISSARVVSGLSLVLSAHARIEKGALARCVLRWCVQNGTKCLATAAYRRDRGHPASGVYRFRREGLPAASVPASGVHYFPLLRVFSGQLFGALAKEQGKGEVLVPWIQNPAQAERLFTPDLSTRTLEYLGEHEAADGLGQLDRYRYAGGQYEQGAEYRLCAGLLWEYRWRQGDRAWRVQLENVRGQWPGAALWPHARFANAGACKAGAETDP